MITKLWQIGSYTIFTETEKEIIKKSDKWYSIIVSGSLFIKQNHKCYTWEEYRKKSKWNKSVDYMKKTFNKE